MVVTSSDDSSVLLCSVMGDDSATGREEVVGLFRDELAFIEGLREEMGVRGVERARSTDVASGAVELSLLSNGASALIVPMGDGDPEAPMAFEGEAIAEPSLGEEGDATVSADAPLFGDDTDFFGLLCASNRAARTVGESFSRGMSLKPGFSSSKTSSLPFFFFCSFSFFCFFCFFDLSFFSPESLAIAALTLFFTSSRRCKAQIQQHVITIANVSTKPPPAMPPMRYHFKSFWFGVSCFTVFTGGKSVCGGRGTGAGAGGTGAEVGAAIDGLDIVGGAANSSKSSLFNNVGSCAATYMIIQGQ